MHESLENKIVLVTGAGGGIGRAIAERFASQGSILVVNDVSTEAADATTAAINDAGGSAMTAVADVSDSTRRWPPWSTPPWPRTDASTCWSTTQGW